MPGILIAGTHSGCGKTTVTLGIMGALRKKGLAVQPFKTGPDFIDAGLHRLAAGRRSKNLDMWMCGHEYVADCFRRSAASADIAVIEGVMGMYDGEFSSAHLANLLQVPIVLVVDAYGMAESAGAVVKGFAHFALRALTRSLSQGGEGPADKDNFIAGVIFNRVASENHFKRLKDSVGDVPVLGYLPRELDFEIPHRHLGLTVAAEDPIAGENLDRLAETALKFIDIAGVIKSTGCHRPFLLPEGQRGDGVQNVSKGQAVLTHAHPGPRPEGEGRRKFQIAVAYDKAFSFYYEDNLELLQEAGAEIVRFSPIEDVCIPENVDAVYIGGGYPEISAEALARNTSMLSSVRAWADSGRPLYAECGGLMYLSQGIVDFDDAFFGMTGVFPFKTRMTNKPRLAYREIILNDDCILGYRGQKCRGHEFHYSDLIMEPEAGRAARIYSVRDKNGIDGHAEGFRVKNTLASYIHVHFGSNNNIAERFARFVKECRL